MGPSSDSRLADGAILRQPDGRYALGQDPTLGPPLHHFYAAILMSSAVGFQLSRHCFGCCQFCLIVLLNCHSFGSLIFGMDPFEGKAVPACLSPSFGQSFGQSFKEYNLGCGVVNPAQRMSDGSYHQVTREPCSGSCPLDPQGFASPPFSSLTGGWGGNGIHWAAGGHQHLTHLKAASMFLCLYSVKLWPFCPTRLLSESHFHVLSGRAQE